MMATQPAANPGVRHGWLACMVVAAVVGGAVCGARASEREPVSIYFVGCGPPSGFHGYLARGAQQASRDLDVDLHYVYPDVLTIANQVAMIEQAIAAQADGIAVCAFAADAAYASVAEEAKAAGIAIGSAAAPPAGSKTRDIDDLFLFRTGSDELAAGVLTANRLLDMRVTGRVLVANQLPNDDTCRDRAESEVATLVAAGIAAEVVNVGRENDEQSRALSEYLERYPETQAVTSVCAAPDGLLEAKAASGRDDLILTGFDILGETIEAIAAGQLAFTIDQQQFWRGYMPVLLLTHRVRYGLIASNYFLTGPNVVDASNVDQVADLVKRGFR